MFKVVDEQKKKPTAKYPKVMTSYSSNKNPYYATVIFNEVGGGFVIDASSLAKLQVGEYRTDINIESFSDYDGTLLINNVFE